MKSRPLTCTVGIAMVGIAILAGTFGSTSCAPRPRPGVVPGAPEPPPLTGFADLHAHPTAHLTMGGRANLVCRQPNVYSQCRRANHYLTC
jgi:hypothetical protein